MRTRKDQREVDYVPFYPHLFTLFSLKAIAIQQIQRSVVCVFSYSRSVAEEACLLNVSSIYLGVDSFDFLYYCFTHKMCNN